MRKGSPVFGKGVEAQHAGAIARPDRPHAAVFATKRRLARAKTTHNALRQVVLAVGTPGIGARYEEERGSAVDDDAPVVFCPGDAGSIFDLESEAHEIRHLIMKARSIVFASAALGKPLCCRAVASLIHHHAM
jgi:hypothetical protein